MMFLFILLQLLTAVTSFEIQSKVIRGERIAISCYSYAAFLTIYREKNVYSCGSSILNQRILLTAAHCIEDCTYKTCPNSFASTGHEDNRKGRNVYITDYLEHPKYNVVTVANDIGIVSLHTPLRFGHFVKRVVLMRRPPLQSHATVAGWGLVNEEPKESTNFLYIVELKLWSFLACRKLISTIPTGTFCAGQLRAKSYVAEGDSGSALVLDRYIQIGIVSYKVPEKANSVGVFTNISHYYDWIQTSSKLLYCKNIKYL